MRAPSYRMSPSSAPFCSPSRASGVLIFFLHHAAISMRSANVIAVAGRELDAAAGRMFPQGIGYPRESADDDGQPDEAPLPGGFDEDAAPVTSNDFGYLQSIDGAGLIQLATSRDLVLRIGVRPGHYVLRSSPLLHAWPAERIDDQVAAEINRAFILGSERTAEQDVEFAIEELVEVAVRALSPGVNDPFTAIRCIDRLTASLESLAARPATTPFRHDSAGELRIVAYPQPFSALVAAAFNQIRQAGARDVSVTIRILESLRALSVAAGRRRVASLDRAPGCDAVRIVPSVRPAPGRPRGRSPARAAGRPGGSGRRMSRQGFASHRCSSPGFRPDDNQAASARVRGGLTRLRGLLGGSVPPASTSAYVHPSAQRHHQDDESGVRGRTPVQPPPRALQREARAATESAAVRA